MLHTVIKSIEILFISSKNNIHHFVFQTCYTSSFFLTISYALEAYFRFRRRLIDGTRLDTLNVTNDELFVLIIFLFQLQSVSSSLRW